MNIGQNSAGNYPHNRWIEIFFNQLSDFRLFLVEAAGTGFILCKMAFSRINQELAHFIRNLKTLDFICGGLSLLVMSFGGLVLLSGFGLVSYQVFLWLQDGVWTEFPIIVVFNFLFENTWLHAWINQPESWYGLQKVSGWILENVPLSLALIIPGLATVLSMGGIIAVALIIRFYQIRKSE